MQLAFVIIILLVWSCCGIWNAITPAAPHIEDMDAHLKHIQSLDNSKERRKYLRNRSKK